MGEDAIFELLSNPKYLLILSNLSVTASESIKDRLSNTDSIIKVLLDILQSRQTSSNNYSNELEVIRATLLAAVHLCKGHTSILSIIKQLSEADPVPEIRTLALESLRKLSHPSTTNTANIS